MSVVEMPLALLALYSNLLRNTWNKKNIQIYKTRVHFEQLKNKR